MDPQRFDALLQRLTEASRPRRAALMLIVGAALSSRRSGFGVGPPAVAASCAKVSKPCKRADQCCSGVCAGKHGKKQCRAHGAGTCKRRLDVCTAPDVGLARCNNNANCQCFPTTAGSVFCAGAGSACAACERDADCIALGFPPGSACAAATTGRCAGLCASGVLCAVPCGAEP